MFLSLLPVKPDPCDPCRIGDDAVAMIQHFEGYSPFVYEDVAGKKTIGFGHLILKGEIFPEPLLPGEADELLRKDMGRTVDGVNHLVAVSLKQNQFDSLVSFTFNLGTGALGTSTLLKRVNAQRHAEVPPQFLRWDKARLNGKLQPVRGLTIRRETEAKLYGH